MTLDLVHFVEWKKVPDDKVEKTLEDLRSWGVKSIVAHPCWGLRNEEKPGYWDAIWDAVRKSGLATPACHAYWGPLNDICPEDPLQLQRIVPLHSRFLDKLSQFSVRTYTMHIGMMDKGKTRWSTIGKAIVELLPVAERCGIILALENGSENCGTQKELADFIASFRNPFLGACFDTGHAHCYGDRNWKRSLDILAPHIVTCHLHDNYGSFDDHNPPGEGTLNWPDLIHSMKQLPRILHGETESGNWSQDSWNRFAEAWDS